MGLHWEGQVYADDWQHLQLYICQQGHLDHVVGADYGWQRLSPSMVSLRAVGVQRWICGHQRRGYEIGCHKRAKTIKRTSPLGLVVYPAYLLGGLQAARDAQKARAAAIRQAKFDKAVQGSIDRLSPPSVIEAGDAEARVLAWGEVLVLPPRSIGFAVV